MKEQTILVTETFYSIQAEGRRVGVPSVFIRVFGCNLNCPGFGQPKGKLIPIEEMPHNTFDVSSVDSIDQLPVFNVGCDSSAAWSKKYRHLSKRYTLKQLLKHIETLYPKYGYMKPDIVITGGEPLLKKYQKFWAEFIETTNYPSYTFETNGTQVLIDELKVKVDRDNIIFSVSPKLSLSGEPINKTLKPKAVNSYLDSILHAEHNNKQIYFKFVIREESDIKEVHEFLTQYREVWYNTFQKKFPRVDVYLMPEGATVEGLKLTERKTAELAMQYGFFYSTRLQCELFGSSWSFQNKQ